MFALFALLSGFAFPVAEGAQDFTLHNKTAHDIDALYLSEVNDDKWGADVLGVDILKDGADSEISFKGYHDGVCHWDVKIEQSDSDGGHKSAWFVKDLDLCSITDLTFGWDAAKKTVTHAEKRVAE